MCTVLYGLKISKWKRWQTTSFFLVKVVEAKFLFPSNCHKLSRMGIHNYESSILSTNHLFGNFLSSYIHVQYLMPRVTLSTKSPVWIYSLFNPFYGGEQGACHVCQRGWKVIWHYSIIICIKLVKTSRGNDLLISVSILKYMCISIQHLARVAEWSIQDCTVKKLNNVMLSRRKVLILQFVNTFYKKQVGSLGF